MRVTETELRGARAQLQNAFDQLASTKGKLEDTQVRAMGEGQERFVSLVFSWRLVWGYNIIFIVL